MKDSVFLNGKFILEKEAKISVLEPGFLYGLGLFETMRATRKKIVYFNEHLKRLKNSCQLLKIRLPHSLAKLKELVKKAVKICGEDDVYVRLTLWKMKQGTGILIVAKKYQPYSLDKYRRGFRVCVSQFRQDKDSPLARLKTTNRILYQLSLEEARNRGFDDAIILNNRGWLTETTRSNLFLVKDKELFTPDLNCGCLGGITRKVIIELAKKYNIKVYEGNFTIQDLYEADEAFLTNSLMGVMPLKDKCKRLTKFFIEKYRCLLK